MEVGTALMVVMLLWTGDFILGAPSNAPALEWAFGGAVELLPFLNITILRNHSHYIKVDGLHVVREGSRDHILRQTLKKT